MNHARRLTPRRAAAQPPAPRVLPHPIPVAPDPTGETAVRNADNADNARLADIRRSIPAKLRPAHA